MRGNIIDIYNRKEYEKPIAVDHAHIEIVELDPLAATAPRKRVEVYNHLGVLVWAYSLLPGAHAANAWRMNMNYAKNLVKKLRRDEVG